MYSLPRHLNISTDDDDDDIEYSVRLLSQTLTELSLNVHQDSAVVIPIQTFFHNLVIWDWGICNPGLPMADNVNIQYVEKIASFHGSKW